MNHMDRRVRRKKIAEWVKNKGSDRAALLGAVLEFSLHEATIRTACSENGVDLVRADTKMKTSTYRIIAALFDPKPKLADIARAQGVSYQLVQQIRTACVEAGIPVKGGDGK